MERYPDWPNLPAMMFALSRTWPERPMLRAHHDGAWHGTDWGRFGRMAGSVARGLAAAGIKAGDRVLIAAENRPEYVIADTALLALRAVPVPAYVTNTAEDHAHLLRDSGARAAIVSTPALAAGVAQAGRLAGGLDLLVSMAPYAEPRLRVVEWRTLTEDGRAPDDVARMAETVSREEIACLIYTSGTGGTPKGVALPHRAILSNCRGAFSLVEPLQLRDETYLSFLPLSHSFEHTVGQYFLPSIGTEIVYARGLDHLAADMLATRPTIMTVVPRVLDVIRARVLAQVARQPRWRRMLFQQAIAAGGRKAEGRMTPLDRALDPAFERLVRRTVTARFGGALRAVMSGGARLEPATGRFFAGLGLMVMQGYGQTEAGPVISANPPDAIRIETVGRALDGVELRIAEDGEILVRGELVMLGYWNQPAATAEVLHDGWLHTGDVGVLDADGYLRITDRKKDMIVLSGGENVSPARVEGLLMGEPEIFQAVVTGDGRPNLSALVVPADGADETAMARAVGRVNARLSVTERIRRHAMVPPFTVENGFLTPTQKIRRAQVLRAHAGVLAGLQA